MERPGEFTKCPCCANPWNVESADYAMVCGPCKTTAPKAGIDYDDFDEMVSPVENFYDFAIGGWRKKNPTPPEYPSWNCFTILHDLNQKRLKEMVDELGTKEGGSGTEKKVADYWASAMDEAAIEAAGIEPLKPLLDAVSADEVKKDMTGVLAKLVLWGCGATPFSFYESPDKKQSEWSIAQIGQGGIGLPDRDYYFDEDKEDKRKLYKEHISATFMLIGAPYYTDKVAADAAADAVYEFEKAMAEVHMTRTDRRDPIATYNKMSVADLQAKSDEVSGGGSIDFAKFFTLSGKPADKIGDINVSTLNAVLQTTKQLKEASAETLSHYLRWNIVRAFMGFDLPKAFADLHFAFYDTALKGTKEQKPRWKRAMQQVEGVLGEALGKLYVAKYFSSESKSRALDVVERVRTALRERLGEVEWMSDSTRERAVLKMAKFGVKIGFPDCWIDYSALEVTRGDHFGNQLRANTFDHNRMLAYMNAETDRSRWYMTPQTINAYYHPSLNEIVFPAALLAPPFFLC